jgi:DNA-binding LacI/PurR family transcriptional regulator
VKRRFLRLNFIYAVKKHYFLNCFEQLYSPLYYYLNKELAKTKSRLDIVFLEDKEEDSKEIIYGIINNPKTDGIFFAGEADRDMLKHLSGAKTPFLFIDYYSVLYNYNYLYIENYQLSYTLHSILFSSDIKIRGLRRI